MKCYKKQRFVKLISDAFAEVKGIPKQRREHKPKAAEVQFVQSVLTKARIEKMLHKFVDEGIVDEDFGLESMGTILKHMGERIFEDIMSEESDLLPYDYDEKMIRKSIGKTTGSIVRKIITEGGR